MDRVSALDLYEASMLQTKYIYLQSSHSLHARSLTLRHSQRQHLITGPT